MARHSARVRPLHDRSGGGRLLLRALSQHLPILRPGVIIEPDLLLGGERDIDEFLETFEETWVAVAKACADFGVCLETIYLNPSMMTPSAQSGKMADPNTVAH